MDIQELRAQIDRIDEKLVPLFLERMGVSLKVAEYKAENHLPVLDRTRERALLKKVSEKPTTPIYSFIQDCCICRLWGFPGLTSTNSLTKMRRRSKKNCALR